MVLGESLLPRPPELRQPAPGGRGQRAKPGAGFLWQPARGTASAARPSCRDSTLPAARDADSPSALWGPGLGPLPHRGAGCRRALRPPGKGWRPRIGGAASLPLGRIQISKEGRHGISPHHSGTVPSTVTCHQRPRAPKTAGRMGQVRSQPKLEAEMTQRPRSVQSPKAALALGCALGWEEAGPNPEGPGERQWSWSLASSEPPPRLGALPTISRAGSFGPLPPHHGEQGPSRPELGSPCRVPPGQYWPP